MTPQQVDQAYTRWTSQLHQWLSLRGEHVDCEYIPHEYKFKIYSGFAREGDIYQFHTVPTVRRPAVELVAVVDLYPPQDEPSQEQLDDKFREICLAAARVLELDLAKPKLVNSKRGRRSKKLPPSVAPDDSRGSS